jgi:hypothetical protein
MKMLTKEQHLLLKKLNARKNNCQKSSIWFNCELKIMIGDHWECFICGEKPAFKSSLLEIDEHGLNHLKESNLLSFI